MPFRQIASHSPDLGYVLDVVASPARTLLATPTAAGALPVFAADTLVPAVNLAPFVAQPGSHEQQRPPTFSEAHFAGGGGQGADGALLWWASHEGRLGLCDPEPAGGSSCIWTLPILSFSLNASNTIVAAGTEQPQKENGDDESPRLLFWDIRSSPRPLAAFEDCHSDDITQVRFHPTNPTALITGSTDGLVNFFDITTLDEDDSLHQVGYFGPACEYVYCLTHVETFGLYTFPDADLVKLYGDVRELAARGGVHLEYLVDAHYEAAEQRLYLYSGTWSGDLAILNVGLDGMEVVHTLNGGHSETVRGVHWDKAASRVVTGGEDGRIVLWGSAEY
ncbi:WD40-repeat-containing domain protein [Zopfochytrium polystomum]|nr:WD40-repeat-containing domain protein [Zopfochytrium polystomum]